MGVHLGDSQSQQTILRDIFGRLRKLEDAAKTRLLPPGYTFRIVGGEIVIERLSDDATSTVTSF